MVLNLGSIRSLLHIKQKITKTTFFVNFAKSKTQINQEILLFKIAAFILTLLKRLFSIKEIL